MIFSDRIDFNLLQKPSAALGWKFEVQIEAFFTPMSA